MEQQKQLHLIMEWDLQWFAKDGPGGEKTEHDAKERLATYKRLAGRE